jgi:hypothetical protein
MPPGIRRDCAPSGKTYSSASATASRRIEQGGVSGFLLRKKTLEGAWNNPGKPPNFRGGFDRVLIINGEIESKKPLEPSAKKMHKKTKKSFTPRPQSSNFITAYQNLHIII